MDYRIEYLTAKTTCDTKPAAHCRQAGFTLIEMIMVLLLMGIAGVFAAMGLSQLTTSFLFSSENAQTAGKSQLAMLRISKELITLDAVASASASSLRFTTLHPGGVTRDYTIFSDGSGNLILHDNNSGSPANEDILTDQVNAFSFSYFDAYNSAAQTSWASSRKEIGFFLTIMGANGITSTFTSRVTPRNL